MMMNGEMMQEALSGKPGSFLGDVCEQASALAVARRRSWLIRSIWPPSAGIPIENEVAQARQYLGSFPDSLQVLQDLFWALLNSNEFVLIH